MSVVRLVPQAASELAWLPERSPEWYERAAAKLAFPVYALDDDSAVRVRSGVTDVVSAGAWRLLSSSAS